MSDFDTYMQKLGLAPAVPVAPTPAPIVPNLADVAQIEQATTSTQEAIPLNVAAERGNDLATQNQIMEDYKNLRPDQFMTRYGMEMTERMGVISRAGDDVDRLELDQRAPIERAGDLANSVATGLVGGLGDAATMPAALINKDLGRAVADLTGDFREGMGTLQSERVEGSRTLAGIRADLDEQDNTNQLAEDRKTDGDFMATLSYIGRGMVDGVSRFIEDPQTLETGLAEGVGSLLAGGPISKGVVAGAAGIRGAAAFTGLLGKVAPLADDAAAWGAKAGLPLSIGLMEGGSAYSGAVTEVMGMSHEDLMENSPSYRQLVEGGTSQDEAQKAVADRAGLIAGSIQAPLGMATGKLVAGFEAAPLATKTFKEAVGNILRETVEEGAQSVTGAIAQNVGIQQADETRNIVEGLGDQLAQGAVLGSLTAGVLQAPAMPGIGARAAYDALATRSSGIAQANDAQSGVTDEDIVRDAGFAAESIPVVSESLKTAVEALPEETRLAIDADTLIDRLNSVNQITNADLQALPPAMLAQIAKTRQAAGRGDFVNRTDYLLDVSKMATDESLPEEDRQTAQMMMLKEIAQREKLFGEDVQETLDNLEQDGDLYRGINGYTRVVNNFKNNPKIKAALEAEINIDAVPEGTEISQAQVSNVLAAATTSPSSATLAAGVQLLQADDQGKTRKLTRGERDAVVNMIETQKIKQAAQSKMVDDNVLLSYVPDVGVAEDEITAATEAVTEELFKRPGTGTKGQSAETYVARFNEAIAGNNPKEAANQLKHFAALAGSHLNKTQAVMKSFASGNLENFETIGMHGKKGNVPGKIHIHANSPRSLALGRRIFTEANMLAEMVNDLNARHPELNVRLKIASVPLPKELFGSVAGTVAAKKSEQLEAPANPKQGTNKVKLDQQVAEKKATKKDGVYYITEDAEGSQYVAGTSRDGEVYVNIAKLKQEGLLNYLKASPQKLAMLSNMGVTPEEFSGLFDVTNNQKEVVRFLAEHEKSHIVNNDKARYPRLPDGKLDLLHPDAIKIEQDATLAALSLAQMNKLLPLMTRTSAPVVETPVAEGVAETMSDGELDTAISLAMGVEDTAGFEALNTEKAKRENEAAFGVKRVNGEIIEEIETLDNVFPNLVKNTVNGKNYLLDAFRPGKRMRLLKRANPLLDLLEATEDPVALTKLLGETPNFTVTAENIEAFRDMLKFGSIMINSSKASTPSLKQRLIAFGASSFNDDGTGPKELERLQTGADVAGTAKGRVMALLEVTPENVYQYNPALVETAMLAAFDWFINTQNRSSFLTKQDVATLTGQLETDISNKVLDDFNRGIGLTEAVRSLADNIAKFWALSPNKDASETYVKGIPEALAKEILSIFEDPANQMMQSKMLKFKGKQYKQYYFGQSIDPLIRQSFADMGPAKKFFEMAALAPDERVSLPFNEVPKRVAGEQLRNKVVKNTAAQKKAIKAAQKIAFNFYENSYDMIQKIGVNGWIEMMGSIVLDENTIMNNEHRESVEGRNRGIEMAYSALADQVAEMKAFAGKEKLELTDIKKYYEYNYSRVNRLQMLGVVNPQSDKIARHVWLPTRSTLDMRDPLGKHAQGFFMAVSQGLGVKNQKFVTMESALKGRAFVAPGSALYPLVQELQEWLNNGRDGSLTEWSQRFRAVATKEGIPVTEHGVMTMLSVAEYYNAVDSGADLSKFVSHNYFEADGVSNGAANTLMNFSDIISERWINTIRKAGAFIGRPGLYMADQNINGVAIPDLYETASRELTQLQAEMRANMEPHIAEVYDALFRMMKNMGMSLKFDADGNLEIGRGVLKNPLTITIYGSGIDGIAGNVAGELVDGIYEAITTHLRSGSTGEFGETTNPDGSPYMSENFWADYMKITDSYVEPDSETGVLMIKKLREPIGPRGANPSRAILQSMVMTANEESNLKANVKALFVTNMNNAIKSTVMGHVENVVTDIQKATNAQSIVLHYMFRKEVLKEMAQRVRYRKNYPNWKPGDFLTANELNAILTKLLPYGAKIDTETQSFFIGSGEKNEIMTTTTMVLDGEKITVNMPKRFSRSTTKELDTHSYTFAPSFAGVGGVPSLVIGTGDGRTIDLFLTNEDKNRVDNVLVVFDGINIPIDKIFEGSRQANMAVAKAWDENPAMDVANSLQAFLRLDPISELTNPNDGYNTEIKEFLHDLDKNMYGSVKPKNKHGSADHMTFLEQTLSNLTTSAEAIGDRKAGTRELGISVDQMAGGGSPHSVEGTTKLKANASDADIANALIRLSDKAGTKRRKDAKVSVATPDRVFYEAFKKNSTLHEVTGVMVANVEQINALRREINPRLSNVQREMLNATLSTLGDAGYKFVFGTTDQVAAWEGKYYPENTLAKGYSFHGKIDPQNQVIYLTNPSAETLAHELLHAATIEKMRAHYAGSKALTETDTQAIERMEKLMAEWIAQDFGREATGVFDAHASAIRTIKGHLEAKRPAEALNEFLAWSLSSQPIISLQKKMQVKDRAAMILGEVLTALKTLIWGKQKAPEVGTDMFSQVRFNAQVLMRNPTPIEILIQDFGNVALYQSNQYGTDERLTNLMTRFEANMVEFLALKESNNPAQNIKLSDAKKNESEAALLAAGRIGANLSAPFAMTPQEVTTFNVINAAITTSGRINPVGLDRAQTVIDTILEQLEPRHLMDNPEAPVGTPGHAPDLAQAEIKYAAIMKAGLLEIDPKGRSTLMPSIMALAMINPAFRTALGRIKMPKPAKLNQKGDNSPDEIIDRLGNKLVNDLSVLVSGEGKNATVVAAVDALVDSLVNTTAESQHFIEMLPNKAQDTVDNFIKTYVEKGSKAVKKWADTLNNPAGKAIGIAAQMLTPEGAAEVAKGATSMFNQDGFRISQREFLTEMIGRTEDNAPVFDMITRVRNWVEKARQQWREIMPQHLASKFSRPLSKDERTDLSEAMVRTDAGGLTNVYGFDKAQELLFLGSARKAEIKQLEKDLQASNPNTWATIQAKGKQLAAYMNTGKPGFMLQKNAFAISTLNGVTNQVDIYKIDALVTLYAMEGVSVRARETLESLYQTEKAGMENLYGFLNGTRQDEASKAVTHEAKMNFYKGHNRGISEEGSHLVVGEKINHAAYLNMGYTFLGNYEGSSADNNRADMGYYFTKTKGQAKFNQGGIRTTRQTVFGVDPDTGWSTDAHTAGRIWDRDEVATITRRLKNQTATTEELMPIYGTGNEVIGYERSFDPDKMALLNKNEDMFEVLGAWRGRMSEESMVEDVNSVMVDNLAKIWKKAQTDGETNQFDNITESTDRVIMDAWSLVPASTKAQIKAAFPKGFMVRRDMVNDAIGARSATVGDFWTGNSRWKPVVRQEIRTIATGIFGNKGYSTLVNAENMLQGFVTDAKVLIVVKSMIVPLANIVANIYQLSMNGVPMRNILFGMRNKTVELNNYIQRSQMELKLQNDLLVAVGRGDQPEADRLTNRIQAIRDGFKRMSIWPLIEAGEFGAITEGGVEQADLAIAQGGWSNFIDNLAKKLPGGPVRDTYRYAMITRDTSMFKALSRATQYGDFLAKAILYDDLTKRKKQTQSEALAFVNEEFVNYNRFAGRGRTYLESVGLMWFYNFKIRSMKVAQRMMHNHPFRAILHTAFTPRLPFVGPVGSIITDSLINVVLDGRMTNSLGPGQLFRTHELHPMWDLINQ